MLAAGRLRVPRAHPVGTPAAAARPCSPCTASCRGLPRASAFACAAAGHSGTGKGYLVWQLLRRPNHAFDFYLRTVPTALGLLRRWLPRSPGSSLRRKRSHWREMLLVCWIAAPVVAFQLWPVKGFQYLLPIVAAVAVLAARGLLGIPLRWPRLAAQLGHARPVGRVGCRQVRCAPSRSWSSCSACRAVVRADRPASSTHLPRRLGRRARRDGGRSLDRTRTRPKGPMCSPSARRWPTSSSTTATATRYGLSVSPNPLHRNPAYDAGHQPGPPAARREPAVHRLGLLLGGALAALLRDAAAS